MKNKFLIVFVLLLLICSIYPLIHSGVWSSHDGQGQIVRIALYTKAINEGQYLVRWSGSTNYTFGSPLFIFYYPLPYYIGSSTHLVGFSFETVFKILMGVGFIASFFTFYLWLSQLVPKRPAIVASCVYLLGTYHILDMYVRGDIGEIIAFAILPLVFWTIEQAVRKRYMKWSIIAGVFYALLILAHNGISLMFSPVILAYMFIRLYSQKKKLWNIFLLFPVGLLLSAFFWIPALYEQKYILPNMLFENMYLQNFPNILSLIFSPWGFGADVNKVGGLSPQIGGIEWLSFGLAVALAIKEKKRRSSLFFFGIGLFLLGVLLATPFSTVLYQHISLLRKFQFPWRFLAYPYVAASFLTGIVLEKIRSNVLLVVFGIGIVCLLPFVKVNGYFHHLDLFYLASQDFTFYHGEAIPRWTSGNQGTYPQSQVALIGGRGKIQQVMRTATQHIYQVDGVANLSLLDNTVYFPGWNVLVDRKKTRIEFQDINHRGLITFQVPSGQHTIEVKFRETADRLLADILSIIAVTSIVGFFGLQFLQKKK